MTRQRELIIQPSSRWRALDLAEVWEYRELLVFFVWRDVKVRYKQTALGVFWVLIRPLLSTLLLTLVFGRLAKIPSEGLPYPLFVLAAMIPWNFFSGALSMGALSLVSNAHLITKVYFPRLVIPLASILATLLDVAIAFVLILALLIWYGVAPPWSALWTTPLLFLLTVIIALGVSLWLGAMNVLYRDIGNAVPFALQLWLYATPIVYPLNLVPAKWRWVAAINPMTGIVEGFRSSLFGRPWNLPSLAVSVAFAALLLVTGLFYFRSSERTFADSI